MKHEAITPFLLHGTQTATVAEVYPKIYRLETISFSRPYELTGVQFSCGFRIGGATTAAAFLILNRADLELTVSPTISTLCSQVFASATGFGSLLDTDVTLNFDDYPFLIPAGQPLSLYVASNTVGTPNIIVSASLFLVDPEP